MAPGGFVRLSSDVDSLINKGGWGTSALFRTKRRLFNDLAFQGDRKTQEKPADFAEKCPGKSAFQYVFESFCPETERKAELEMADRAVSFVAAAQPPYFWLSWLLRTSLEVCEK